jgi:hypothetical protein
LELSTHPFPPKARPDRPDQDGRRAPASSPQRRQKRASRASWTEHRFVRAKTGRV